MASPEQFTRGDFFDALLEWLNEQETAKSISHKQALQVIGFFRSKKPELNFMDSKEPLDVNHPWVNQFLPVVQRKMELARVGDLAPLTKSEYFNRLREVLPVKVANGEMTQQDAETLLAQYEKAGYPESSDPLEASLKEAERTGIPEVFAKELDTPEWRKPIIKYQQDTQTAQEEQRQTGLQRNYVKPMKALGIDPNEVDWANSDDASIRKMMEQSARMAQWQADQTQAADAGAYERARTFVDSMAMSPQPWQEQQGAFEALRQQKLAGAGPVDWLDAWFTARQENPVPQYYPQGQYEAYNAQLQNQIKAQPYINQDWASGSIMDQLKQGFPSQMQNTASLATDWLEEARRYQQPGRASTIKGPPTEDWLSMLTGVPVGQPVGEVQNFNLANKPVGLQNLNIPSPQAIGRLNPTQQTKFTGYLNWAGVAPEDIQWEMQRRLTRNPSQGGRARPVSQRTG